MKSETCLICSENYLAANTKDHQCPDMGCMDCTFVTDNREELLNHSCNEKGE
jgi:hypothetical protein